MNPRISLRTDNIPPAPKCISKRIYTQAKEMDKGNQFKSPEAY